MASKSQQAASAERARTSSATEYCARCRQELGLPTKTAAILGMLNIPKGATILELAKLTGWQKQTVRSLISGRLRKKLGYTIISKKVGTERVYRIGASR